MGSYENFHSPKCHFAVLRRKQTPKNDLSQNSNITCQNFNYKDISSDAEMSSLNTLMAVTLGFGHKAKNTLEIPKSISPNNSILVAPKVLWLCESKEGSKSLQRVLESGQEEDKKRIFEVVEKNFVKLSKMAFGNYIVQMFVDSDMTCVIKLLTSHMSKLLFNKFGSRVVEKAVRNANPSQTAILSDAMSGLLFPAMTDQNASHVLQTLFMKNTALLDSFLDQSDLLFFLSKDIYGSRVVQKMVAFLDAERQKRVMDALVVHMPQLFCDQNGNYVVQTVLIAKRMAFNERICDLLAKDILKFCCDKFSSNVVEKCYVSSNKRIKLKITQKILFSQTKEIPNPIRHLAKDKYGNFVLQRILKTSCKKSRAILVGQLKLAFAGDSEGRKHFAKYLD